MSLACAAIASVSSRSIINATDHTACLAGTVSPFISATWKRAVAMLCGVSGAPPGTNISVDSRYSWASERLLMGLSILSSMYWLEGGGDSISELSKCHLCVFAISLSCFSHPCCVIVCASTGGFFFVATVGGDLG